jgi:hypothetical protein
LLTTNDRHLDSSKLYLVEKCWQIWYSGHRSCAIYRRTVIHINKHVLGREKYTKIELSNRWTDLWNHARSTNSLIDTNVTSEGMNVLYSRSVRQGRTTCVRFVFPVFALFWFTLVSVVIHFIW